MTGESQSRPIGVTIIAILNIISGVFMLIAGIGIAAVGSLLPSMIETEQQALEDAAAAGLLGAGGVIVGAILIILGFLSFIVAWGLLKAKIWAWTVTIVLAIVSIVLNLISLIAGNIASVINVIISAVIIYYLYRPHVRTYFGKTASSFMR